MTPSHQQVLTDIERLVRSQGATLDETDARIAEVLGVPSDYYFAYLLVWGAIEAQAQARARTDPHWQARADASQHALDRAESLVAAVGQRASAIYRQASETAAAAAAYDASQILGSVLQLRQNLRDLRAACDARAGSDGGAEVVGRG